jgi:hypothetical protein
MAEDGLWEDLAKRLVTLVTKIDERDTRMVERLDALQTMVEEQRTFNKTQLSINERLETLMTRALRQEPNGRDA